MKMISTDCPTCNELKMNKKVSKNKKHKKVKKGNSIQFMFFFHQKKKTIELD